MDNSVAVYSELDAPAREVAREAVAHIAAIQQRVVTDIAEIGSTLIRVKDALGHGHFLTWIKAEFDWTERTAQNYMSVAERFGSNAKCLSHLPLATVYKLAAPTTPDELRDEIVAKLEQGETVEPAEIASEIAAARREAAREKEQRERAERRKSAGSASGQKALSAFARKQRRIERERERANRLSAERDARRRTIADFIVANLGASELEHLIELLWPADSAVTQRDLTAARDRLRG